MESDSQPLRWFVTLFNYGYPDWDKDGDQDATLEADDVEYSWTISYWAKCGPRSGSNEVYFARNKDWWGSHDDVARIGLLIHELAHYKHTDGHSPSFYRTMGNCYNRIQERSDSVEDALGIEIDFSAVAEWLIKDIEQHQVDTRKQTVYDARLDVAKNINYDIYEQMAINGIDVDQPRSRREPNSRCFREMIENLSFEPVSMEDVSSWLRNPRKDYVGVADNGSEYIVSPIPVSEIDEGTNEPADDDARKALSLLHHTGKRLVALTEDG